MKGMTIDLRQACGPTLVVAAPQHVLHHFEAQRVIVHH